MKNSGVLNGLDRAMKFGGFLSTMTAFALFSALAFYFLGPAITNPSVNFAVSGDTKIALAILEWGKNCLYDVAVTCGRFPIFYPMDNALYYTEHMLGISAIYSVVRFLGVEMHCAYNMTWFLLTLLSFTTMWLLFYRVWFLPFVVCVFASVAFALQPFLVWYIPHIQLVPTFLLPLIVIGFEWLNKGHAKGYILISVSVGLQFWFGMSLGVFAELIALFCYCYYLVFNPNYRDGLFSAPKLHFQHMVIAVVAFAVIITPLYLNYQRVVDNQGLITRNLVDTVPFSFELSGLIYNYLGPDVFHRWFGTDATPLNVQDYRFWGWLPLLCVGLSSFFLILQRGKIRFSNWLSLSNAGMIFFFVLSLGPYFIHLGVTSDWLMPYALFFHIIPGLDALRVPIRFVIIIHFFASISTAILVYHFWKMVKFHRGETLSSGRNKISINTKGTAVSAICMSVIALAWYADRAQPSFPVLKIEALKASVPVGYSKAGVGGGDKVVLDFPMWPPHKSSRYMYYQLYDHSPRIGGVSSNFPIQFMNVVNGTAFCPREDCFALIEKLPADWFVVHTETFTEAERLAWNDYMVDFHSFKFKGMFENIIVWERSVD